MNITNESQQGVHRGNGDFQLAESLGCHTAASAPSRVVSHWYQRTAPACGFMSTAVLGPALRCPFAELRGEMEPEPDPDMARCGTRDASPSVEEWRAQQAAPQEPLFYGYEALPQGFSHSVSIDQDDQWGDTLRPAGDNRVFATEGKRRDAWVKDGPL